METTFEASNHPNQSYDIRQFGVAFIKAKRNFKKTGLDATNPHFKSKYAKLPKVYEAVEEALWDEGISPWHMKLALENGITRIFTRLTHVMSGQWIQDSLDVDFRGKTQQEINKDLTQIYKKGVMGLCAIHYDEDDDGEGERERVQTNRYADPSDLIRIAAKEPDLLTEVLMIMKLEINKIPFNRYEDVKRALLQAMSE